ncbi:putative neutral zinc metallopeptidase [Kribbella voronezhensis]|uniref:Putative neutral zinc metallopeptidase n=1 Tax=Kribbella voronezhensis TaxID=2512212 RepID=A0A4R7TG52_9ACTN|nr:neutral zinc metallopeptidase [Kribbella voronezhensis]TDU91200.1 putative neutral zinc metallopeptidase [Kribbella voronezhensis]
MSSPRGSKSAAGAATLALMAVVAVVALMVGAAVANRKADHDVPQVQLGRGPAPLDPAVAATQRSLVDFWAGEFPAVYGKGFEQLRGGFQPKSPQSPPFTCAGKRQTYEDLKGNAFYCGGPGDDYIAYDSAQLFPQLNNEFGGIAPAVVLAHEMGHAIQRRAGVDAPSVVTELQADCFSGSWLRYTEKTADDPVGLTDGALDTSISTILVLRDQPGTPATNPQAHGLGFDRVNAFQTGYEGGARGCAAFPEGRAVTTELPFRTVAEARTGGNLPFSEAIRVLSGSLDDYWTAAMPQVVPGKSFNRPARRQVDRPPEANCVVEMGSGYCSDGNAVVLVTPELLQAHQRIGDLATGAALSEAWGLAVQFQAGLPSSGRASGLQRDCFTGAWLSALAGDGLDGTSLSPGDVDEVLATIVADSTSPTGSRLDRGGAFERTAAMRRGLFQGLGACR